MINNFLKGVSKYQQAIGMVSRHNLWSYVLIPGLISVAIAGLLFASAVLFSDNIADWMASFYPENWIGAGAIKGFARLFSFSAIVGLSLFLFKYIVLIVSAPFMGPLSEKVESIKTGRPAPKFSLKTAAIDLSRSLRINLRNLLRELMYTLLLLPLQLFNFIPGLGVLLYAVATFLLQAYYAGFGNMDPTLERRPMRVRERVRFVRANRGLAMGNGSVFLLLVMIPFLGWFLAPAYGTISATLVALERLEA